ncbi:cadherin-87A-like [Gigantopelta aegis]|uniref:cadherin-87A-like n=1 Tax=Gigantopelta aegis TaxID=1735272 RepID=UPI001B889FA6|nr:cadherin-87A-like [Gigantopelta aegis]
MDHILVVFTVLLCGHYVAAQNKAPYFFENATMNGFHVSEDTPVGTVIYQLQGIDPNGDQIFFFIKPENEELVVNKNTGVVSLKAPLVYNPLDYERKFTIIITDQFGVNTQLGISIFIDDANNQEPKFTRDTYQITVPESTQVNSPIISGLSATDADYKGAPISVTCNISAVENPDQSQRLSCETFRVEVLSSSNREWSGNLILQKPLDFETRFFYQVPLVLSDGLHFNLQSIEINLEDVNDAPPLFERALSTIIDENMPAFSYITNVLARDGDVNKPRDIAYELTCHNDSFSIQSSPYGQANITNLMTIDKESDLFQERGFIMLCIKAREIISPGLYGNDALTTADTTIRITVRDMNDNAPTFHQDHFNVSIYESIPNLASLPDLFMTVTDKDSSTANSYDFVLMDHTDVYEMHPKSGQGQTIGVIRVIDTSKIDYEIGPRTFILRVEARENFGGIRLTGTATVTVYVLDVNDNVPQFRQSSYEESVKENESEGHLIVTVSVVDPDSGNMGSQGVRFSLVGNGAHLFKIDPQSGEVRVAYCDTPGMGNCIDYERKKKYDLNVIATDELGNGLTSNADLIINVLNINDNRPVFERGEYINSIMEGKIITLDPLIVTATDRDGDSITYSIPRNQQAGTFWQINSVTGNVTAISPIRFEDATTKDEGFFQFQVQATDGTFVEEAKVTIYVIDVNDNAPIFQQAFYREEIPENTGGGVHIVTVTATDKDSNATEFGRIEYRIRSGAEGKFEIDYKTGEIKTTPAAKFDFDITREYNMIVVALDGGNPQKSGTATVQVEIIDENNKNPYFRPTTQRVDVKEDVAIGTSVATIVAQDPDANVQLEYSFIEPQNAINPEGRPVDPARIPFKNWFTLEPSSGFVKTRQKLDRDQASVLTLTMRVVDISASPRQTGTGTLIITVLEVNDQSPQWPDAPYSITINEEQAIGTFIMTLIARDSDDSIASYQLVNNRYNFFAISPSTGVLTIKNRIDYDIPPYISSTTFTVLATDSGFPQRSNQTTVFVTITNINDNSPIFDANTYNTRVDENSPAGTSLMTVHARDKDREDYGEVRYKLDASENRFTIDKQSGVITTTDKAKLDRETQPVIAIQVVAYDSPNHPTVRRNISVPVYFILDDINDNKPVFSSAVYRVTIIETIDIGAPIIQMFVTDEDIGINEQIAYAIINESSVPDNAYELFSVGKQSGRIIVKSNLRGHAGAYTFKVNATDRNGRGWSSTATIYVNVTSAVNSPPKWTRPPYTNFTISVLESQYLGMLVYDAHAEDNDTGTTGLVDYSFLVPGQGYVAKTPAFRINPVTGVIRAEIVYDREGPEPRYVLELAARDRGSPRLVQTRFLYINILDVNDNKPVFEMENGKTKPIEFEKVKETAPVNTYVGRVNASDADSEKYSKIYYYIISGNDDNTFYLESTTGKMYLAKSLDHEKQSQYLLYVFATNNISDYSVKWKRRRRSTDPSIATVLIPVEDENDAPPVFVGFNSPVAGVGEYYGCISNTASYGRSIVTVSATDADSQGPSGVRFSIASGNSRNGNDNIFHVHDETGLISNRLLLNTFAFQTFVLTVQASDSVLATSGGRTPVTAKVKIFVTSTDTEVKLVINQKATEVQNYVAQIQRILQKQKNIHYVCITKIRDHLRTDGTLSDSVADVFVSAAFVNPGSQTGYSMYSTETLANELNQNYTNKQADLDSLHITSINPSEESSSFLTREPVLAVLIIIILLVVMALILFCIACYCIAGSRTKKTDKATAAQRTYIYQEPVVEHVKVADVRPQEQLPVAQPVPVVQPAPVYDNSGFEPEDEYAVVQKRKPPTEQEPVIVAPVDAPSQPDDGPVPVIETYPVDDDNTFPPLPPPITDEGPLPVIETYPVDDDSASPPLPPPVTDEGPVPVIETYPVDDDGMEQPPPPPAEFRSHEPNDIEVEIKEDTPMSTPVSTPKSSLRHSSPPTPRMHHQIDTEIRD